MCSPWWPSCPGGRRPDLIGCVAAFAIRRRADSGEPRRPSAAAAIARIAAGLVVLLGTASMMPIELVPAPTALGLAAPLAWLAACPPATGPGHASPYVRVLLPALALLGMLHAYPVFGSQAGLAAVAFVPVGALVLSDGLRELEASSTAWAAARGVALASVVAVGLAALMVKLAAQSVVQPGLSTHKAWAEARPLPFGGRSSSGRSPARTCDPGTSSPTAVGSPDGCSRTRHSISATPPPSRACGSNVATYPVGAGPATPVSHGWDSRSSSRTESAC